jgi:prevent-host-death family protein
MNKIVNVREATRQFSRLLDQAHAGEEIILAKAGKPYARLMPLAVSEAGDRRPGRLNGRLEERFFDPLPADELQAWES